MSIAIRRNVRRAGAALMAAVVAAALCLNAAMPAHADDKQKELENKKNELQSELDRIRQQLTLPAIKPKPSSKNSCLCRRKTPSRARSMR